MPVLRNARFGTHHHDDAQRRLWQAAPQAQDGGGRHRQGDAVAHPLRAPSVMSQAHTAVMQAVTIYGPNQW